MQALVIWQHWFQGRTKPQRETLSQFTTFKIQKKEI